MRAITDEAKEVLGEISTQAADQCEHLFVWVRLHDSWHSDGPYQCPEGPMSIAESCLYTRPLAGVDERSEQPPELKGVDLGRKTKVFTFEPTGHTNTVAHLMRIPDEVGAVLDDAQRAFVEEIRKQGFAAFMLTSPKRGNGIVVVTG